MNDRIERALTDIINRFRSGDIPEPSEYDMLPIPDIPPKKWSNRNKGLMLFAGTYDARAKGQWKKAGRRIKTGALPFNIVSPRKYKVINDDGEEEIKIDGYHKTKVFKYEDTEGKDLNHNIVTLPVLPLADAANRLGISVKPMHGNIGCKGYYFNSRKEIVLAVKDDSVYFQELAHAAHAKIKRISGEQTYDTKQDIACALTACVLCQLFGNDKDKHLGNIYKHIRDCAMIEGISPIEGCQYAMPDVKELLQEILS